MDIRAEYHFRRGSLTAGEAIDTTTYDLCGRYGTDGEAYLCGADERPQFLFAESATDGEAVSVVFCGHGWAQLRLYGTGNKGDKLTTDSSGRIVASNTAQDAALASKDFAIALQDWSAGQETECDIITGA